MLECSVLYPFSDGFLFFFGVDFDESNLFFRIPIPCLALVDFLELSVYLIQGKDF